MLAYPPGCEQRPTRLSAASLRPEFKQKLAKHEEATGNGAREEAAGTREDALRGTLGTLAARHARRSERK